MVYISKIQEFQIKTFFDGWTVFLLLLLIINMIGLWAHLNGYEFVANLICGLLCIVLFVAIVVWIFTHIYGVK